MTKTTFSRWRTYTNRMCIIGTWHVEYDYIDMISASTVYINREMYLLCSTEWDIPGNKGLGFWLLEKGFHISFQLVIIHSVSKLSDFCCGIRDNDDYQLHYNIAVTPLGYHCVSNHRQLDDLWNYCGFFPNNTKRLQVITLSWYAKLLYWDITNIFMICNKNIIHIHNMCYYMLRHGYFDIQKISYPGWDSIKTCFGSIPYTLSLELPRPDIRYVFARLSQRRSLLAAQGGDVEQYMNPNGPIHGLFSFVYLLFKGLETCADQNLWLQIFQCPKYACCIFNIKRGSMYLFFPCLVVVVVILLALTHWPKLTHESYKTT